MGAVTVLDGGVGHELKRRGVRCSIPGTEEFFMSSALANVEHPEEISRLHGDFIAAGASIITTNSYVVTPYMIGKFGLDPARLDELLVAATANARAAASAALHVKVAGSVPPLRESYQIRDLPPDDEQRETYRRIANVLAPSVDLLLCETLSSPREARNAADACGSTGRPTWVSFSLRDDTSARQGRECVWGDAAWPPRTRDLHLQPA